MTNLEILNKLKEDKITFKGQIANIINPLKSAVINPFTQENSEVFKDYSILVKDVDLDGLDRNKNLLRVVSEEAEFSIIEIDEEKNIIFVKARVITIKQKFLEHVKEKDIQEFEAIVPSSDSLKPYGIYLTTEFNGKSVPLLLTNENFSNGTARCSDILSVGETVIVKIAKVSRHNEILVEMVKKYEDSSVFQNVNTLNTILSPNSVILGYVTGIRSDSLFVRVGGLADIPIDGICGLRDGDKLYKGAKVSFIINKVDQNAEDKKHPIKVNGYIVRILRD